MSKNTAIRPGPGNLITDVDGLSVGNAADEEVRSGVTVLIPESPATVAVDVRGGAPGSRETEALSPACLIDQCHGLVLSGGSVFGLDAAGVVCEWLSDHVHGLPLGARPLPVVPAAILFDRRNGGVWEPGTPSPWRRLARQACEEAGKSFSLGNRGAGFGAIAGPVKGGLGSASFVDDEGLQVGALAAVNSFGSPLVPGTSHLWAAAFARDGEMGVSAASGPVFSLARPIDPEPPFAKAGLAGENTTLCVVATNVRLDKAGALRLAIMAQDGLARAIRPAHTPFDGDVVFALATGQREGPVAALDLARIGCLAADCLSRAIGRAVYRARPLGDCPALRG